jgi:hypothetical protein
VSLYIWERALYFPAILFFGTAAWKADMLRMAKTDHRNTQAVRTCHRVGTGIASGLFHHRPLYFPPYIFLWQKSNSGGEGFVLRGVVGLRFSFADLHPILITFFDLSMHNTVDNLLVTCG